MRNACAQPNAKARTRSLRPCWPRRWRGTPTHPGRCWFAVWDGYGCVEELAAHDELEAVIIDPADGVTWSGDELNPPPE